jgi:hypothetical protein
MTLLDEANALRNNEFELPLGEQKICPQCAKPFTARSGSGGKPALDDHGYRYSKKLAEGDNPKTIAGRLTRELRAALRGKDAPVQSFDSKIEYFNRGKI